MTVPLATASPTSARSASAFEFGRRPCVDQDGVESDESVAPDGRRHRLCAAAVDAIVPANLFRTNADRHFRGFTWNSRR